MIINNDARCAAIVKSMGWAWCLCSSGGAEPLAGGGVVGLHQPAPEEGRGGDRACQQNQQGSAGPGWAQVPVP